MTPSDTFVPSVCQKYLTDPDFIESHYGLSPIREIFSSNDRIVGVARFIELPSFEPECLNTLIFTPSEIQIETVEGKVMLWHAIRSDFECGRFARDCIVRRKGTLNLAGWWTPRSFKSWSAFKDCALQVASCDSQCLDGIGYRQRLCDRELEVFAEWNNPEARQHSAQISLVKAYSKLLRAAGLR